MNPTVLRMVLASFIAGTALPGLAAKLESTTPVPPGLFADRGESLDLMIQEERPADPAPTGTIDPKALILPLSMTREGQEAKTFWCAIDRSAPETGLDVLRIDTRCTGSFKNAEILKLKPDADGSKNQWEFSGIIPIKIDGKEISCLVTGNVSGKIDNADKVNKDDPEAPFVMLSVIPFASTSLDLNGKTFRIAVADGNGDGDLADAAKLAKKNYPAQPEDDKAGDLFAIDLDGNGFKGRTLNGYLGVPFCLDGHWLTLKTDAQGAELTSEAQPNPGTGTLELPPEIRMEALISGGGRLFSIVNGQPPIPLKAGKYRLVEGRLLGPGKMACEFKSSGNKAIFEINDDAKTSFPMPKQIKLSVNAECEAVGPVRLVSFGLAMKSDASLEIGAMTQADGAPLMPTLKILDAQGKVVHTGKFEFG